MNDDSNHISIIWDFDNTLTPQDSTSELIKLFLKKKDIKKFWNKVKKFSGTKRLVRSISTSDAPVWMYMLAEKAVIKDNKEIVILL